MLKKIFPKGINFDWKKKREVNSEQTTQPESVNQSVNQTEKEVVVKKKKSIDPLRMVFIVTLILVPVVIYATLSINPQLLSCNVWLKASRVPVISQIPLVKKRKHVCSLYAQKRQKKKNVSDKKEKENDYDVRHLFESKNFVANNFQNLINNKENKGNQENKNKPTVNSKKKQDKIVVGKEMNGREKEKQLNREETGKIDKEKVISELKQEFLKDLDLSGVKVRRELESKALDEEGTEGEKEGVLSPGKIFEEGRRKFFVSLLAEINALSNEVQEKEESLNFPLTFSDEQLLKNKFETEKMFLKAQSDKIKLRSEIIKTLLSAYAEFSKQFGSQPEGELAALTKRIKREIGTEAEPEAATSYRVPQPTRKVKKLAPPKPLGSTEAFEEAFRKRFLLAEPEAIWLTEGYIWPVGHKGLFDFVLKEIDLPERKLVFAKENEEIIINF